LAPARLHWRAASSVGAPCSSVPQTTSSLIEKYGRDTNMMKWKEQLNGDCPES